MHLSADSSDDDSEIEYIGSSPPSPSHRRLAALLPPVSNEAEHVDASQKAKCKQHVVSARPGQMAIGTYPFLLHVEEDCQCYGGHF